MNKILYKSLPADKSPHGHTFKLNKWYKEENIKICERGFHASENAIDAMNYVDCGWIAKVEVRGEYQKEDNKECWSEMRIIKWKKWTKKDSVSLAIYAAELVIDIFEKEYPNDKRPRNAIEAAKKVLKNDTAKNRAAAKAAGDAAWAAAWAAGDAAGAAAWAAWASWAAGDAARAAARAAAWAAWAAWDAGAAARAARDKIKQKCHDFVITRAGL